MIVYSLLLEDGTTFALNGDGVTAALKQSMTLSDISVSKSSNIIARSYGDGSAKVGGSRLTMNQLVITLSLTFSDDASARLYINRLFSALKNAEYLIDETTGLRTKIDLVQPVIAWDAGCYLRSGDATITLNQLVPYWETVSMIELTEEVDAGVPETFLIENAGYAETPFLMTVSVEDQEEAVALVEVQNLDEGRAIIIQSDLYGLSGYTSLEVNCDEGTSVLVDAIYGTEVDVQSAFEEGSGYFNLVVGSNALELRCSVDATFLFQYRPRFYV